MVGCSSAIHNRMTAAEAFAALARPARPVSEQPRLTMEAWRLMGIADDVGRWAVVLVGRVVETGASRVSSPVASIDALARSVTTRSGRVYDLLGPTGKDEDADLLLRLDAAARGLAVADLSATFCIGEEVLQ